MIPFRALALALAVAVLPLVAPPVAAQDLCPNLTVSGQLPSLIFADGFESGGTDRWGQLNPPVRFAVVDNLDLVLGVDLDGSLSGDHVLHLDLRLPGDGLYQRLDIPFAPGAAPGAQQHLEGYPFPVAIATLGGRLRSAATVNGAVGLHLDQAFPVAGTAIVDGALYGDWSVEARLDDQPDPCGPVASFVLIP